jgi:hypothetical protein
METLRQRDRNLVDIGEKMTPGSYPYGHGVLKMRLRTCLMHILVDDLGSNLI